MLSTKHLHALDSILCQFLGESAYLYIIVTMTYLASGEAPIAPAPILNMALAFMLYYFEMYITFSTFIGVATVNIIRWQKT